MTGAGSVGRHDDEAGTHSLADLTTGAVARIVRVVAPVPALAARLADLGFTAGTQVLVGRRAPLGDPVIYRLKDYEVALRRALAQCVQVSEVSR